MCRIGKTLQGSHLEHAMQFYNRGLSVTGIQWGYRYGMHLQTEL
jgi:hypothetical protein